MTQNPDVAALAVARPSARLDDRLSTGDLAELIDTMSVVRAVANPTIFHPAVSKGHTYDARIRERGSRSTDVGVAVRTISTHHIRGFGEELDAAAGTRRRCRAGEHGWDGR